MENQDFDREKMIKYWVDSSEEDFETMIAMYDSKQKTCTSEFTAIWIENLKNQRSWIKRLIEQ